MIEATYIRRAAIAAAVLTASLTPLATALDYGSTSLETSITAGGPPGVVEPAPPPPPPPPPDAAPAALPPVPPQGSGIRDPRCGTDLFTGIPLPC